MSRTIEVFTIKEVKYTDQFGFARSEKVKDETMVLTMTDRTSDFEYYNEVIKAPIAVNEDGVDYIGSVATDFGPTHQAWTNRVDGDTKIWFSRYSGKVGELLIPIDPTTIGVTG